MSRRTTEQPRTHSEGPGQLSAWLRWQAGRHPEVLKGPGSRGKSLTADRRWRARNLNTEGREQIVGQQAIPLHSLPCEPHRGSSWDSTGRCSPRESSSPFRYLKRLQRTGKAVSVPNARQAADDSLPVSSATSLCCEDFRVAGRICCRDRRPGRRDKTLTEHHDAMRQPSVGCEAPGRSQGGSGRPRFV